MLRRALTGQAGGRGDRVVEDPSILLREVMRNVPQPVAVAVTSVPPSSPLSGKAKYHGATLTSFTSLTLYPHPLVAFSLRLPSRMADCLRPWRTHLDHQPKRATSNDDVTSRDSPVIHTPQPSSSASGMDLGGRNTTSGTGTEETLRRTFGSRRPVNITSTASSIAVNEGTRPVSYTSLSDQQRGSGERRREGIVLPPKSDLPWPLSKLPMPEQPPEWAQSLFAQIPNPLASPAFSPFEALDPSQQTSSRSVSSPPTSTASLPTPPSSSPFSSVSATSPIPPATVIPPHPTPLTISLLSTSNESIADSLASPRTDHSSIFNLPDTWSEHTTHPPSLINAVGALQCEVVGSVMLKDLCGSGSGSAFAPAFENAGEGNTDVSDRNSWTGAGQLSGDATTPSQNPNPNANLKQKQGEGSELFICRVVGVEMTSLPAPAPAPVLDSQLGQVEVEVQEPEQEHGPGKKKMPLLHWRRKYVSIDQREFDLEKA
ncbi:hypothetical protein IAU59_000326 [Kwoniella sp. CBS 9459]